MGWLMPELMIGLVLAAAAVLAFPAGTAAARRLRRLTGRLGQPGSGISGPRGRLGRGLIPGTNRKEEPFGSPQGLRDPAMVLELVAAMLESGSGLGRALDLVAAASSDHIRTPLRPVVAAMAIGADWDTAWQSSSTPHPDVLLLRDALGFAAYTGAPSASILYAQAARIRRDRFRQAEKRAASLGVKLVIPLGLCSLPAFICLGVVPVLLALVPSGG